MFKANKGKKSGKKEKKVVKTTSDSESDSNEIFFDAIESENVKNGKITSLNNNELDGSIKMTELEGHLSEGCEFMKMFLNNQIPEVMALISDRSDLSLVHATTEGALMFFESIVTLDVEKCERCIKALKYSSDYADQRRRKSFRNYIFTPNYDEYTDLECLAEMFYASNQVLMGLVTVLKDQSIYGLINGALTIRVAHQSYKECSNILKNKTKWDSDAVQMHFESGTRMGIGSFDLVISFFPNKMARLLEFAGFCGDREIALDELTKSVRLCDGLLYDISSIFLSAYHGFLEYFYGLGEGDLEFFEWSKPVWNERAPDSSFTKLGLGIAEQIAGRPDTAIVFFHKSIEAKFIWSQANYACYWHIIWCHAMKCDWANAVKYTRILKDECKWSPAMFTYLYSVFQFMVMEETNQSELKHEISENFKRIPQLKRKFGGKRTFHELIVIERSKRFHDQVENLLLPPLELFYIWNMFHMMAPSPSLFDGFLQRIDKKLLENLRNDGNDHDDLDRYAYLTFMKGVCYRHLERTPEAIDCFNDVLTCKKKIVNESHLLPQSLFEIGLIRRKQGELVEAKKYLKKARDDYSGYLTVSMIQFRVQMALDSIKHEADNL